MSDVPGPSRKEPAEGSRDVIDRELERRKATPKAQEKPSVPEGDKPSRPDREL